jgi:hypothetical protein
MCRRTKKACTLLGNDPTSWSIYEPLPAVTAVLDGFEHLQAAVRLAAEGHREAAHGALADIDGAAIQDWYVEHAQISGTRRLAVLGRRARAASKGERDKLPYPSRPLWPRVVGIQCRACTGIRTRGCRTLGRQLAPAV